MLLYDIVLSPMFLYSRFYFVTTQGRVRKWVSMLNGFGVLQTGTLVIKQLSNYTCSSSGGQVKGVKGIKHSFILRVNMSRI